ncbi:MAG: serine hydrolase domain-containing protein [Candidatus Acidiferrales bacterium]
MPSSIPRRRLLSIAAHTAAAIAASQFFVIESGAQSKTSKYAAAFRPLDDFIEQYMRGMNSPGMTFVTASREGIERVATYGFSDLRGTAHIDAAELFQIGSITKSIVANCLLQLRQEGKLDLHKPVREYLPWFRVESKFPPITTHHMLTHTSGLPDDPPVFLSDPAAQHRAAYAPGQHFHYSNMAFSTLGHLLAALDGRPLAEVIRKRVFEPLGMTQSEAVISMDIRDRMAGNYSSYQNDRPYPRFGRLCEGPGIIISDADGCIASTPRDMGLYIQMIANHGKGPRSVLLSDESFALFSKPYIPAEEFGPTASYGYGIAVDTFDGHQILRHTGGMVSFASAIQIDIDQGVGAFASINAMQGYRPTPVVQFAVDLMRAQEERKPRPPMPPVIPATRVENAGDYAGVYHGEDGRKLEIDAADRKLFLLHEGARLPLENSGGDTFLIPHPDFSRFLLVFGRADTVDVKGAVVDAGWGGDWYTNSKYAGAKKFEYPAEWNGYTGHYRNESPWIASMHIVIRKGTLWIDGVIPLEMGTEGDFHLRDEAASPEWIRFADRVNGQCMRIKFSGEDLWRVFTP